ncbi:MAG: SgcJ/EcaC family oxidoreductase [Vicinamibacteria bacterium]
MKHWRCGVRDSVWRVVASSVLSLVWLPASSAAQAVGPEALVAGFVRAWNTHDMKALGGLFAEDADFVNVTGRWWKGRAEIQAKHEETHATRFKTTTLAATGTVVRLPRPDVAVIHFNWELTGEIDQEGKAGGPRRGVMQIVAAKQAEGWTIIAAQNTNALPPR